jgi:hypothetical protein
MDSLNDKLPRYREIIERVLSEVARYGTTREVQDRTLFDRQSDSYAIISEGWHDDERIHHVVIHLEIINGKVWIQADNTDLVIARELERAGIPKSDIVLGFHPPDVRPHTDYAAT